MKRKLSCPGVTREVLRVEDFTPEEWQTICKLVHSGEPALTHEVTINVCSVEFSIEGSDGFMNRIVKSGFRDYGEAVS